MTEISRPWTSTTPGDAGAYSQDNWALLQRYLCGSDGDNPDSGPITGSGVRPDPGLTVTQRGAGANMSVDVSAGSAMVNGTFYNNSAVVNLVIAANASGNPRVDVIVLNKDWSAQTVRLLVVQGTPAGSPVPTAMVQTALTQWQIPLADIAVANGAVSITNANITPRGVLANGADGTYETVLNNSGVILQAGDVVVWDFSANRAVKTTTTAGDVLVAGVIVGRIAIGGYGKVITQGMGYVNSSAATTRGDGLRTHTVAKQAVPATAGSVIYQFATALETTGGAGLVFCKINCIDPNALQYLLNNRKFVENYQAAGADYTLTAATTWTNIDTTNMACQITPDGTRVRLRAIFDLDISSSNNVCFDWLNNNSGLRARNNNVGSAEVLVAVPSAATPYQPVVVEARFTGLTPGTVYNFYLQYYKISGSVSLRRNGFPTICIVEEF